MTIPATVRIQGITYRVKKMRGLEKRLLSLGYPREDVEGAVGFYDSQGATIFLEATLAPETMAAVYRHELGHAISYCLNLHFTESQCDIIAAILAELGL
jgi:hypothetical protein